jgi:hypothetical protein
MDRISVTLLDSLARARNLLFSFISYGKLVFDLPVFNLRHVFQECIFHVNREGAVEVKETIVWTGHFLLQDKSSRPVDIADE